MTRSQPPDENRPAAGATPPAGSWAPPPDGPMPPAEPMSRPAGHRPPAGPATADLDDHTPRDVAVTRSRLGGLWVGLIVAAVILVLLLVFVLQNSQTVQVDYFGLSGQLPLAVAILLGVAAGALLVALPGSVRIVQLRKAVRRQ